jgi:hypothetical protein
MGRYFLSGVGSGGGNAAMVSIRPGGFKLNTGQNISDYYVVM